MATTSNDYDFMKYRAANYGNNATNISSSAGNGDYQGGMGGDGSYYPSYEEYPNFGAGMEQPSSWLHGSDFNSLAGDLFTSKPQADPSFGNLSLNLDQIKIVSGDG